jgi:hypothetical protein
MTTLAEIRSQYPQYGDMSDAALADALHKKFYSDIPRAEFDARVGLEPAPAPTAADPSRPAAAAPTATALSRPAATAPSRTAAAAPSRPAAPTVAPQSAIQRNELRANVLNPEFADAFDPGARPQSVLEGVRIPEPAIQQDKMLNPEFVDAMKRRLGAMGPDKRAIELDRLTKRRDVYGRAARVVAAHYAELDRAAARKPEGPSVISRVLPGADSRSEVIERSLIEQGLDPEAAKGEARVRAGFYGGEGPKLQSLAPDVVGQEALERAAAKAEELKDAGFARRVGAEMGSQAKQVGLGLVSVYADIVGDDALQRNMQDAVRIEGEVGRAIPKGDSVWGRSAQQAIATLATQTPFILLGAVTGTAAPVLAPIALQVFGKEYGEGRQANLSPAEATTRAGLLTASEFVFERFGLTELFKSLRGTVNRIPTQELAGYLVEVLKREAAAEQFTQATNFLIDKAPGIGLNPNAGWQEFLEGQAEALRQTVLMSGAMAGAIMGTAKGLKTADRLLRGREPGYVRDTSYEGLSELLARQAGFLQQPTERQAPGAPETAETAEAPPRVGVRPTIKPEEREARVAEVAAAHVSVGIDPTDAERMAEAQVEREYGKAAEAAPQDKAPENRVDLLTQDFIAAGEDPQNARVLAERQVAEEEEADALAEASVQGAKDVAEPVTRADRVGPTVAGQPGTRPAAPGGGAPESVGVVPVEQPAPVTAEGETATPAALTQRIAELEAEQQKLFTPSGARPIPKSPAGRRFDALQGQIADLRGQLFQAQLAETQAQAQIEETQAEETQAPEGEQIGAQAPQTVEAETQGPAAPAQPAGTSAFLKAVPDANGDIASYKATEQEPWRFTQRAVGQVVTFTDSGKTHTGTITEVRESDAPRGPREFLIVTDSDPTSGQDFNGNPAPERWTLGNDAILDVAPAEAAPQTAAAEDAEATQAAEQTVGALIDQVQKPKRGRKTQELTPEEKTRKEAALKEYKRKYAKASRDVARATAQLNDATAPFDETAFADEDALKAAQADRRQNFLEAVRSLMAIERGHRGTPLGNRAKDILNDRSKIPQKDYDNIKKGFELTNPSKALTSSRITPNPLLKGNMSALAALNAIGKNGTPFERMLANRLRNFLTGVRVYVVEAGDPIPARIREAANAEAWERARGVYLPADATGPREVYVRGASFGFQNGVNNVTILHELLHAAINYRIELGMVGGQRGRLDVPLVRFVEDLNSLMVNAAVRYDILKSAGRLPPELVDLVEATATEDPDTGEVDLEIFTLPQEFLAYGLSDPVFQKFLGTIPGVRTDESAFSRFVRAILEFLGLPPGQFTGLSDLINITDDVLGASTGKLFAPPSKGRAFMASKLKLTPEQKQAAKEQRKLDNAAAEANAKFDTSKLSEEYAKGVSALQMAQNPKEVIPFLKGLWAGATDKTRRAMVKPLTLDFIATVWSKEIPELKNTALLVQRMNGQMMQLLSAASDLTDDINRAYRKDPTLREKLNRITRVSTKTEFDPSNPDATLRNLDLDKQYEALGADGQRLYKRIKNHYVSLSDYFTHLLNEQITRSGLPLTEQSNLLKKIRVLYETSRKIEPYFPLMRRGDYWFSMGTGKNRVPMMFETLAERDRAIDGFLDERVKQKPGESDAAFQKRRQEVKDELFEDKTWSRGNYPPRSRDKDVQSSELLKGMFAAIDASSLNDPEAKEKMKDDVYQLYLQTMPEQSFRRRFIHREGLAGYSTDILRDVADSTAKIAVQLSRIKYAPLLRNSLQQARSSIENRPELEPVVVQVERMIADSLNPAEEGVGMAISNALNRLGFVFYLGGLSSALIQPLSMFITGMPVLSRYGTVNANREFMRALAVWKTLGVYKTDANGNRSWAAPSIEYAQGLSADERRAIRDLQGLDLFSSTAANAVFDYKKTPSAEISGPATQFGKDFVNITVLGGLMHSTDRLTREMMALASYNLNRQAGKDHADAVKQVAIDVNEAFGNYAKTNRPLFMRGPVGNVLTQFMMFPLHVTLYLLRNFREIIKPLDGRTRWEATKKFFGTLGATFVLGGVAALPWVFSAVLGFIASAWKALGEDDDRPKDVRGMDFFFWWRTQWLDEQLGETRIGGVKASDVVDRGVLNAITGADFASRLSLNNLWLREGKETQSLRDQVAAFALEKAGPSVNALISIGEGVEAAVGGDYKKMLQKAAPAGFRNFATTYELWKQGSKDNKGTEILSRDAFTTGELLFQIVGFRSDLLANTQYVNFKAIGLEQKIKLERGKVLDKLDRAYRENDADAYAKYIAEEAEFNSQYPTYKIEVADRIRSLQEKAERRGKSWRGVTITKENAALFADVLRPSRAAATEKEQAARK